MRTIAEFIKAHIHHVRKLRAGSRDHYECLDCGKRLRILSGVVVANPDKYEQLKREHYPYYLDHAEQINPFPAPGGVLR